MAGSLLFLQSRITGNKRKSAAARQRGHAAVCCLMRTGQPWPHSIKRLRGTVFMELHGRRRAKKPQSGSFRRHYSLIAGRLGFRKGPGHSLPMLGDKHPGMAAHTSLSVSGKREKMASQSSALQIRQGVRPDGSGRYHSKACRPWVGEKRLGGRKWFRRRTAPYWPPHTVGTRACGV